MKFVSKRNEIEAEKIVNILQAVGNEAEVSTDTGRHMTVLSNRLIVEGDYLNVTDPKDIYHMPAATCEGDVAKYELAGKDKQIVVNTAVGAVNFVGHYLPERETDNWHYYMTSEGETLHFRKEHIVVIQEREMPDLACTTCDCGCDKEDDYQDSSVDPGEDVVFDLQEEESDDLPDNE